MPLKMVIRSLRPSGPRSIDVNSWKAAVRLANQSSSDLVKSISLLAKRLNRLRLLGLLRFSNHILGADHFARGSGRV